MKSMWEQREIQSMVIPGIIFVIIFSYLPIYGVLMAFQEYRLGDFPGMSEWVGLKYFKEFLSSPNFGIVMANTLIIGFYKLAICFTLPIVFAFFVNEVRHQGFKRTVQTISYLPHFISWVVVSAITFDFLAVDGGTLNGMLMGLHLIDKPIMFLGEVSYFRSIIVITDLWKEMGWNSIIFIAAMAAIDTSQYEAADIDGANRLQKNWYITLPGIKPTITILLVLAVGNFLNSGNGGNSGFEQIFLLTNNLKNSVVAPVSKVLDVFTYQTGIQNGRYSYATAIGLFKSVVSVIMLFGANYITKLMKEETLF